MEIPENLLSDLKIVNNENLYFVWRTLYRLFRTQYNFAKLNARTKYPLKKKKKIDIKSISNFLSELELKKIGRLNDAQDWKSLRDTLEPKMNACLIEAKSLDHPKVCEKCEYSPLRRRTENRAYPADCLPGSHKYVETSYMELYGEIDYSRHEKSMLNLIKSYCKKVT